MNFELLGKIIAANPEKALDVISRTVDLIRASPLLQSALAKYLESLAK